MRFLSKGLASPAMCFREINLISSRKKKKKRDWGERIGEVPSEKVIVIRWRMEV